MKLIDSIKKDFVIATWALMPLAIAINLVASQIVSLLKLPIFLDSIGTVLVAVVCGPWAGLLTGVITNIVGGILLDPSFIPFAPVAAVIGLVAGLMANVGWFKTWWKAALSGIVVTLALIIVAAPIKILVYGGITPNSIGAITSIIIASGHDVLQTVLGITLVTNLVDKIITTLVAWGILVVLPARLLSRFPRAENVKR